MKKNILFLILALAFAAVSCQKTKVADKFVIERTECTADYEGGSVSIVVNTNLAWTMTAQDNYDWLTPSCTSGNGVGDVFFVVSANAGEERTAKYTFSAGSFEPIEVSITQEAVKSEMKLGTPYIVKNPYVGVEGITVIVPYVGANGTEEVPFVAKFSGIAVGELTQVSVTVKDFTPGNGEKEILLPATPTALGPLTVTMNAWGEDLEPATIRVWEKPIYKNYIYWNYWAIGYTRSDFNYMRGSKYDLSYTSQAVNPTTSGVGEDHKALPSACSLPGCDGAYLCCHSANPIVAAGDDGGKPTGTPTGLAGYQFNPGLQLQGLVKGDYFLVYIPSVSIAAGKQITLESSLGGASAAACTFLVQYSTDNKNWITFDSPKSKVVDGEEYLFHYQYLADNSAMRYIYAHDTGADPAYAKISASVKTAINGPLYVRFLAAGLNGKAAVQTGTGWSEVKFIELAFD